MGRPSLLTPETHDSIMKLIEASVPFKTAAEANGITYATFQNWRIRGRDAIARSEEHEQPIPDHDAPYVKFFEAVPLARARGIAALVVMVRNAARTDPRTALRLLAVYEPDLFADRRYLDVAMHGADEGLPVSGDVLADVVVLPDVARADALLGILTEAGLLPAGDGGV
jgi:hypothetical protein